MAVSLNRPPPRVTAYGPYGASAVAGYRPTAQGYVPRTPRQTPFQAAAQEHGAAGYGNYPMPGGGGPALPGVGAGKVTAPAGPGGGMNLGGVDWTGLIGGDYGVQDAESQMASTMQRKQGDFQSQLRQMLVDLGVTDTSKLGNLGKYIDAQTIQNAAANKYSQVAQIGQQEAAANAQNQAALAARGILTSGQMTTDLENTTAQAEQARYQGLRDFLSSGAQGLGQLADIQDQLAQGVAQARAAAADRAAQTYYWQQMMAGYGAPQGGATQADATGMGLGALAQIPGVPAGLQPSEHAAAGFGNYDYMHPVSWYRTH